MSPTSATPDPASIAAVLDADGVLLFASDGDDLYVAACWPSDPAISEALRIPIGFGVTGLVARNGRSVRLDADAPRNPLHRQLLGLADGELVARVCVPVRGLYGEIVGVLAAHRSSQRPFLNVDLEAAARIAAPLGLRMHTEQLWRAVHRHRSERDLLIAQAISAQEGERRRIAFDLHDGVTTVLASMAFHLNAAEMAAVPDSEAAVQIASARHLADLAYDQTRAAISGLHSLVLDDLGLVAALESLVQHVLPEAGPDVVMLTDPDVDLADVPDHVAAALYRMAQEALGNAVKHAGASRIVLSLRRLADAVVLGCTDDGVGFDVVERRAGRALDGPAQQSFGLSSIEQRSALLGASLRIESMPGRGTTVIVEVPLAGGPGSAAR